MEKKPDLLVASVVPGLLIVSAVLGLLVAYGLPDLLLASVVPGLLVATEELDLCVASMVLVEAMPVEYVDFFFLSAIIESAVYCKDKVCNTVGTLLLLLT